MKLQPLHLKPEMSSFSTLVSTQFKMTESLGNLSLSPHKKLKPKMLKSLLKVQVPVQVGHVRRKSELPEISDTPLLSPLDPWAVSSTRIWEDSF